jgi:hypothetical protein
LDEADRARVQALGDGGEWAHRCEPDGEDITIPGFDPQPSTGLQLQNQRIAAVSLAAEPARVATLSQLDAIIIARCSSYWTR